MPTVKDWIRRGTLKGQMVGSRWSVSEGSVGKVFNIRQALAGMEENGYPTEEEIYELTKRVRHQMVAEKKAQFE